MDGSYILATRQPTSAAATPRPASPVIIPSSSSPTNPTATTAATVNDALTATSNFSFTSESDQPQHVSSTSLPTTADSKDHATPSRQDQILDAVDQGDLTRLKQFAGEPRGFESSHLRRKVWPVLLGVSVAGKTTPTTGHEPSLESSPEPTPSTSKDHLEPHKDERQVHLDILRSFVSYPVDISAEEKQRLRDRLENVIVTILRRHPALQYFQGYHDIISILLLTFGDEATTIEAAERMSLHRLRDSMGDGLEPVLGYLRLLHRILSKHDAELAQMVDLAASLPYFSLSWVLTLMSHDLTSIDLIARLFDFLLAHNPAMISYLGVAIVLLKKDELAALDDEDPAMVHHTLSKVPKFVLAPKPAPVDSAGAVTHEDAEEDEDLMSSSQRSDSFLSTSVISTSEASTADTEVDWDRSRFGSMSYSLEALDDSMFEDPDVVGLAFPTAAYRRPTTPTSPAPKKIEPPGISIEDLITSTLSLYSRYPLVSSEDPTSSIKADEVMGPKSCIFTWPLSVEGRLSDKDADAIAAKGIDIVLPEPVNDAESEIKEDALERRARRRRELKNRRRRFEVGVGAVVAIAGVTGVVLALYGTPAAAEESSLGGIRRGRSLGAGAVDEWRTWGGEVLENLRLV